MTYDQEFTYNASHDILTQTDRGGKVWTHTYNADSSLASTTDPLSHTWSIIYRTTYSEMTDPLVNTTTHNYSSGKLAERGRRLGVQRELYLGW